MIGAHGSLPAWGKWPEWWYGEDDPPESGGQSAEAKKTKESAAGFVSVTDAGGYTWIVYSKGHIKIYATPSGKEHLMGRNYYIGDANYASILTKLRKLDPQVDKILAQGGLSGKDLSAGKSAPKSKSKSKPKPKAKKTYTPAPPSPSYPPQPYVPPPTPNGKGGKPFPVWTIPVGVVVLVGLGLLIFRRRKPKNGKKK